MFAFAHAQDRGIRSERDGGICGRIKGERLDQRTVSSAERNCQWIRINTDAKLARSNFFARTNFTNSQHDDITEAVVRLVERPATRNPEWSGTTPDPASSSAPWRVYNIGNNNPVEVRDVVRILEEALGRKAQCELLPMQPGDVAETYADVAALEGAVGFKPKTPIEDGIRSFVRWYETYKPKAA